MYFTRKSKPLNRQILLTLSDVTILAMVIYSERLGAKRPRTAAGRRSTMKISLSKTKGTLTFFGSRTRASKVAKSCWSTPYLLKRLQTLCKRPMSYSGQLRLNWPAKDGWSERVETRPASLSVGTKKGRNTCIFRI
jgi:hypothetical protein